MAINMVRENLVAARELIKDPNKWCQKSWRDSDGRRCALGAIFDSSQNKMGVSSTWSWLEKVMGMSVGDYNDSHTHAEVLAMFDKAIGN